MIYNGFLLFPSRILLFILVPFINCSKFSCSVVEKFKIRMRVANRINHRVTFVVLFSCSEKINSIFKHLPIMERNISTTIYSCNSAGLFICKMGGNFNSYGSIILYCITCLLSHSIVYCAGYLTFLV